MVIYLARHVVHLNTFKSYRAVVLYWNGQVASVFIFGGGWFLSADFPNMARSVAIVTTLVLIRAIFSIMVECFVSTTCARFVWSVGFVLLSATESC